MMNESSYRHGLRVRIGSIDGPRGVLWRCHNRDGSVYWRVRLQHTGAWVSPGGLIVDGAGAVVTECEQCGLKAITPRDEHLCSRCRAEMIGTATRGENEPARRRWIRRIKR